MPILMPSLTKTKTRTNSLILVALAISSLAGLGHSAFAQSETLRSVQVDWEPIEGATRYEFESFEGALCDKERTITSAEAPTWKQSLAGGRYCVRIRANGEDGKPGQWSDYQRLEVRPKPPRDLTRTSEGGFEWSAVPKVTEYQIKVIDTSGKTWFQAKSAKPAFDVPASLYQKPGIQADQLQVVVQSIVPGVEPSVPMVQSLLDPASFSGNGTSGSYGAAGTDLAGGTAGGQVIPLSGTAQDGVMRVYAPTQRAVSQGAQERLRAAAAKYPDQVQAYAPDPDEAVKRYLAYGERPVQPSDEEWAMATNKESRENLKRRTIASQRIELIDRIDRSREPDVLFSGSLLGGNSDFSSTVPSSTPGNDKSAGVMTHLRVEYNRNRPWGAYVNFFRKSVQDSSDSSFSLVTVGAVRNIALDPVGESELRLGAGFGYGRFPLMLELPTAEFSYPIAVIGAELSAAYAFHFTSKLAAEASFQIFLAPTQPNLSDVLPKVHATQALATLGVNYDLTRKVNIELGGFASGASGESSDQTIRTDLTQGGAYLKATYRLRPLEARRLASVIDARQMWVSSIFFPVGIRSTMVRNNANAGTDPRLTFPFNTSGAAPGVEVSLVRRFDQTFGWSVNSRLTYNTVLAEGTSIGEMTMRLGGAYDMPFLGSPTTSFRLLGSFFYREAAGDAGQTAAKLYGVGFAPGVQIGRHWGGKWSTEMGVELGVPALVGSKTAPLNNDAKTQRDGANYFWRASASVGYDLTQTMQGVFQYSFEQLRFGASSSSTAPVTAHTIDIEENRLRLGLQWKW